MGLGRRYFARMLTKTKKEIQFASFKGGSASHMDGATLPLMNESFTIKIKVRRNRVGVFDWIIWSGSNRANNQVLQVGWRDNNNFIMGFWNNDLDVPAQYVIQDNRWHEYILTFNNSTKLQSIYQDRVLVGSRTSTSNYIGDGITNIGGRVAPVINALIDVDDIKIWNAPLTKIEAESGIDPAPANLIVSWGFNGNANDDSGNDRHLTVIGTAKFETEII